MLWIIDSLVYGFFTALYTLVNQKHKFNGYVLGIWRGFGISLLFLPFLFFIPLQKSIDNWALLIFQGIMIGIYDSHLFFSSAKYGAGATSRVLSVAVLITTIIWWILTPQLFFVLVQNENVFITLLLALSGFSISYWYMIKEPITKSCVEYMAPAIFSLAGMSAATKEIAMMGQDVWHNILYYLVVATFVSGIYNTILYVKTSSVSRKELFANVFAPEVVKVGIYIVGFSAILIASKTMAMRLSPNPGYVVALMLTAPIFVFFLNKYNKIPDNVSIKVGFCMVFFLVLLMLIVNMGANVID
ncbi:MAG: hypothetical protein E7019_00475 [Alphaproteobacteria bacterium]|nr:hypothetical protein [Alphaproteobacteria bacterium]